MRVGTFVASFLSFAALTLSVVGMFLFWYDQPFLHPDSLVAEASSVQEVVATAAFPDTNAFSRAFVLYSLLIFGEPNVNWILFLDVVNGQKNTLKLTVENKLDRNVTLTKIAGALLHPETNALIKNVRLSNSKNLAPYLIDCLPVD